MAFSWVNRGFGPVKPAHKCSRNTAQKWRSYGPLGRLAHGLSTPSPQRDGIRLYWQWWTWPLFSFAWFTITRGGYREQLSRARVKTHGRGHDLHTGVIERDGLSLDIGVISTGMGCPGVDLIVTELIALGAQVMVRVGTCGSLQPHIHTGDIIAATAAVRDEGTTRHYLPPEVPAMPSFELVRAMLGASEKFAPASNSAGTKVHFGPVHTKDSLYAREFGFGPLKQQHVEYQDLLTKAGVVASEMECAQLFVLGTLGPLAEAKTRVHTGAVLAVIGDHDVPFKESPLAETAVDQAIGFALDSLVAFHRL